MLRRTTIEIDDQLLARAKRALGEKTTRSTVERALRQAADSAESLHAHRAARQQRYLRGLHVHVDTSALESEQMWR